MLRALRAELLKLKNGPALWLTFPGTLAIGLAFGAFHLMALPGWDVRGAADPWGAYAGHHFGGSTDMLLPLFVIITAVLVYLPDNLGDTWKRIRRLGVPDGALFWSKTLAVAGLLLAGNLFFAALVLVTGALTGIAQPDSGLLRHGIPWGVLLGYAGHHLAAAAAMLVVQSALSWRFTNIVVPFGLGTAGYAVARVLAEQAPAAAQYFPYAYPLLPPAVFWQGPPVWVTSGVVAAAVAVALRPVRPASPRRG